MRMVRRAVLFTALALGSLPHHGVAADASWSSAGVRGGMSTDGKDKNLRQFELFALYQLPWELRSGSGWGVGTGVEVAAGILNGDDKLGFIGSFGPSFTVGKTGFPLELNLGVSAAGLTRDRFGREYNGYGQFISHGGLNYRFSRHLGAGYRYQHMSNAGLNGGRNPGVNMHLFAVNWYLAR